LKCLIMDIKLLHNPLFDSGQRHSART
jgi:hypothetical protein